MQCVAAGEWDLLMAVFYTCFCSRKDETQDIQSAKALIHVHSPKKLEQGNSTVTTNLKSQIVFQKLQLCLL